AEELLTAGDGGGDVFVAGEDDQALDGRDAELAGLGVVVDVEGGATHAGGADGGVDGVGGALLELGDLGGDATVDQTDLGVGDGGLGIDGDRAGEELLLELGELDLGVLGDGDGGAAAEDQHGAGL